LLLHYQLNDRQFLQLRKFIVKCFSAISITCLLCTLQ